MRRLSAVGTVLTCLVLSIQLSGIAGAQEQPQFVLPPPEDVDLLLDSTADAPPPGQANQKSSSLPALVDTPPRTRPPGPNDPASTSPDFLRGLQLADTGSRPGRQSHQSLLAPAQFHGNVFGTGGSVSVGGPDNGAPGNNGNRLSADIPAAGGNARFSIADNNKPLPQNRIFFDYRHYNNSIGTDAGGFATPLILRRQNFDNFLLGIEKTLDEDELVSIDIRVPFSGNANVNSPGYAVSGDQFGNIPVSWKQAILLEDSYSVVAGSTLITPTGGNVSGQMMGTPFSLENEAWHLAPFIGGMLTPRLSAGPGGFNSLFSPDAAAILNRTTFQFFGAVDFPLNDQSVIVAGTAPGGYREPMFMSLNSAVVLNLFNAPKAKNLTRLDGSVELHYLKNIGGGSSFASQPQGLGPLTFSQSRVTDVLNMTAGLSAEIRRNTRIQVAAAAPLASSSSLNHRAFDGELIISINRFF